MIKNTTQSGFTPTPNFPQSMLKSFKQWSKSSWIYTLGIGRRRERSSQRENWCRGFTLIEMIVSLALFSVVVTVSVGALLMLVATNEQLQGEQSVMVNLSFALDSMTREIRTGTNYYCISSNSASGVFNSSVNVDSLNESVRDCPNGNNSGHRYQGVAFIEAGDSITEANDRILYYFDDESGQIFRKVGQETESIVSSGIYINYAEFFVTGTQPLKAGGTNRDIQPTVTIYIEATEDGEATAESHYIQTTVTQRTIDI